MVYLVQSKEDLEKQLVDAGEKLVVIDFFATWCGPCKIIAPKLDELAVQYQDQTVVLKVDVDECEEIVIAYKVISMPTFVFIKNQTVIDMFVGGNVDKLVKTVEKYVGDGLAASDAGAPNVNTDNDLEPSDGAATTESTNDDDEEVAVVGAPFVAPVPAVATAVPSTIAGAVEEAQQAVES